MKRLIILGFLSLVLSACAGGPSGAQCRQGVCIQVQVVEPVRFGTPVKLTISVTTERDIPGLGVSLLHNQDAQVDDPRGLETEIKDMVVSKGGVDWIIDTKANRSIRLVRAIQFTPREGFFTLVVSASTPQLRVGDSVGFYITRAGATVYYSGTPASFTPGPLPTITAGPSPTFIPTPTRRPYP